MSERDSAGTGTMTRCRGCRGRRMDLFLPLGSHPLANGFLEEEQLEEPEATFPLDGHVCLDCGLIQIPDHVPDGFFEHYVYVPSASDTMRRHFEELADVVVDALPNGGDGLVVDIGCNDGLFLDAVRRRGVATLGVDPAENIIEMAREKGLEVVGEYFDPDVAGRIVDEHGSADAVVTTNTYHHIGDLETFTRGVADLLSDEGVFVIEVPHALDLVREHQFDGIYHEHVSQFTLRSVADHVERFGLRVVDAKKLPVHGGSMRVFVAREGSRRRPSPEVDAWLEREAEAGLFEAATYDRFRRAVEEKRRELMRLLSELRERGRRLAGYGASARGNTLLNYYGLGPDWLEYIADRNELKQGLYTPGTHIPVVETERLVEDRPDYVLLLAWNFADEIVEQQAAYREAGGRFIVPIPDVRILEEEARLYE